MHRAVMKLIIVFLMSLIVGISAAETVVAGNHAPSESSQVTKSLPTIDADDTAPAQSGSAETCHEACHWLVAWYWSTTGYVYHIDADNASATQHPGLVRLVLPPPRSA